MSVPDQIDMHLSPIQPSHHVVARVTIGDDTSVVRLSRAGEPSAEVIRTPGAPTAVTMTVDGRTTVVGIKSSASANVILLDEGLKEVARVPIPSVAGLLWLTDLHRSLFIASVHGMRPYSLGGKISTDVSIYRVGTEAPYNAELIDSGFDFVNSIAEDAAGRLVVIGHKSGTLNHEVYVYNKGRMPVQLIESEYPVYSGTVSNGQLLVVSHKGDFEYGLYHATIAGNSLVLDNLVCVFGYQWSFGISADGRSVLGTVSKNRDRRFELRTFSTDGTSTGKVIASDREIVSSIRNAK